MEGLIVKGIAGFYYVHGPEGLYECKARGRFRKDAVIPQVGDRVEFDPLAAGKGNITRILPRTSSFIRPPVANINQLFITFAATQPEPDLTLVDKLAVTAESKGIRVVIVITKTDLDDAQKAAGYRAIYEKAGYPVVEVSTVTQEGIDRLGELAKGAINAFAGCSGVGKSSVLNAVCGRFVMETGEISEKIQRGRHTTRHVELLPFTGGGYVVDTPGFSSVELPDISAAELEACFPEFADLPPCRFRGCSHTAEPDCAVAASVAEGAIAKERYEHYKAFYEVLKQKKAWK